MFLPVIGSFCLNWHYTDELFSEKKSKNRRIVLPPFKYGFKRIARDERKTLLIYTILKYLYI